MLADGDEARCRALLADALRAASDWVELPALAEVIDAIAVLALHPASPGDSASSPASAGPRAPASAGPREGATLAATLLGAAHSVRGCFDEGSLDAPAARDAVRARLGEAEFSDAYEDGRALAQDDAVALAASTVASPVKTG